MIAYDLQCSNGHTFEGWFEDPTTFEQQQAGGLIACPVCNTVEVFRVPSTFAIKNRPSVPAARLDVARLKHRMAEFIATNFENVGPDFSKEALKIHYGVTEPRNIRGSSTDREEKILRQEGVQFFKFPVPAGDDDAADKNDS